METSRQGNRMELLNELKMLGDLYRSGDLEKEEFQQQKELTLKDLSRLLKSNK